MKWCPWLEDLSCLQVHIRVFDLEAFMANFMVQPNLVRRIKTLQKNDSQLIQLIEVMGILDYFISKL